MRAPGLKRRLAVWLFGVLSALLVVDAWFSYSDALGAANQAYDRSLSASVKGIAERVYATEDEVVVDIPYSALELFEAGSSDRVYYSVGVPGETAITGYEGLPLPESIVPNTPVFYDGIYKGQQLRLGAMLKPLYRKEFPKPVIVVIGETTNTRQDVVRHLFFREVARKALLVVVTLAVALFATMIAVQPIDKLGQAIRARPDDDLTPIMAPGVPREVKPLVDAINLHMERIEAMVEARRRFIADAAHQLRTPLAVLNTQAEYALRQQAVGDMRTVVEALHRSLGSAIRLTNQLLSLSRAEPINGLMLTRQVVDIAAVARDTVVELLPLAERKRIDLGFEGATTPLVVSGHPVLLREMLTNLIDNALRYTPEGGVVTVAVDHAPDSAATALLRVIDNGPGIPAASREQVFLRFFRLDGGDHTGSGLGLSIVPGDRPWPRRRNPAGRRAGRPGLAGRGGVAARTGGRLGNSTPTQEVSPRVAPVGDGRNGQQSTRLRTPRLRRAWFGFSKTSKTFACQGRLIKRCRKEAHFYRTWLECVNP